MDEASWNAGRQIGSDSLFGRQETEEMEFWRTVLTNRRLRSRFIRDLEVQSIASRSAEDLARRYREEEILPRG
jgi:hypothetical protein